MAQDSIQASGFFIFKRIPAEGVKFLLIRSERDGLWGFPKGRLDSGETSGTAAVRELYEETGIKTFRQVVDFSAAISYKVRRPGKLADKSVDYYLAEVDPKTSVILSDEHLEYKWLGAENVKKLLKFENLRDAFQKAADFLNGRPA